MLYSVQGISVLLLVPSYFPSSGLSGWVFGISPWTLWSARRTSAVVPADRQPSGTDSSTASLGRSEQMVNTRIVDAPRPPLVVALNCVAVQPLRHIRPALQNPA